MTTAEVVAQAEAEAAYRQSERNLRRQAKWALLCDQREEANRLLGLAHLVGMEFIRNHIGSAPDRWEQPGTVIR
jgi:hypothetical protein